MYVNDIFRVINLDKPSPESKSVGSSNVLNFLVVPNYTPEKYATRWINVAVWGANAEKLSGNVNHKDTFHISGDLQIEQYETDNGTRQKESLRVDKIVRVKTMPLVPSEEGTSNSRTSNIADNVSQKVATKASANPVDMSDEIPF